jgi:anti-anti-sigma factor
MRSASAWTHAFLAKYISGKPLESRGVVGGSDATVRAAKRAITRITLQRFAGLTRDTCPETRSSRGILTLFSAIQENTQVRIEQDIDVYSSPALRTDIARAIQRSNGAFEIDLREVRYIDSVGLGLLIYAKHILDADGRRLCLLIQPHSNVERILDITGLRSLLGIPGTDGASRV